MSIAKGLSAFPIRWIPLPSASHQMPTTWNVTSWFSVEQKQRLGVTCTSGIVDWDTWIPTTQWVNFFCQYVHCPLIDLWNQVSRIHQRRLMQKLRTQSGGRYCQSTFSMGSRLIASSKHNVLPIGQAVQLLGWRYWSLSIGYEFSLTLFI
jgi:hypothetical protein